MKLMIATIVAITSACATTTAIRYVPIAYTTIDEPLTRSLRLVFHNRESGNICLGPDNWPTPGGYVDTSGDEFYVEVDGSKYYLQNAQDYCPTCFLRVRPGQTIEARLNYASFGLPEPLYSRPKELHLTSIGYSCR